MVCQQMSITSWFCNVIFTDHTSEKGQRCCLMLAVFHSTFFADCTLYNLIQQCPVSESTRISIWIISINNILFALSWELLTFSVMQWALSMSFISASNFPSKHEISFTLARRKSVVKLVWTLRMQMTKWCGKVVPSHGRKVGNPLKKGKILT